MKLFIAEDEALCRENLTKIDWSLIGVSVCGVAENGSEAIKLIKTLKPDIIISDIEMPGKNGLELANEASNILPDVKVILLTAYAKFEYVQQSVALGVYKYILKPFNDNELLDSVQSAVEELELERNKAIKFEIVSRQLESCKYFLKSYFFNVLDSDSIIKNKLFSIFGELEPISNYTVVTIKIDTDDNTDVFSHNYKIFLSINKIISKYHSQIIPFFDIYTMTFLFIHDTDMADTAVNSDILNILDAVCDFLNFNDDLKYIIGVGKCVHSLKDSAYSYSGAESALAYSFYLGFNTVICISDVEPRQSSADYFKFYDEGFLNHVKVGNSVSAINSVKKLFDSFQRNQESIQIVQRICNELFARISMCLVQCGQNPDNLFDKTNTWHLIKSYSTIDGLEECICNIVEVTISRINYIRNDNDHNLIIQIQNYIKKNPSTSLNEIAEHFFHSPNYLSNIFSKNKGTTIKNYIIQTRIDVAKEMLSQTKSGIPAIANSIGYKKPQHFSNTFKKIVGVTPTEYRNSFYNND